MGSGKPDGTLSLGIPLEKQRDTPAGDRIQVAVAGDLQRMLEYAQKWRQETAGMGDLASERWESSPSPEVPEGFMRKG